MRFHLRQAEDHYLHQLKYLLDQKFEFLHWSQMHYLLVQRCYLIQILFLWLRHFPVECHYPVLDPQKYWFLLLYFLIVLQKHFLL